MHLVIAKIVAIVIFTWMAWAVWKQYVLLLNKEGKHYEKLPANFSVSKGWLSSLC